jgi:Ca2+-binding EF-hand superfamily protein
MFCFVAEFCPYHRRTVVTVRCSQARLIFDAFVAVDDDNSGQMSVEEFHRWLGVPQVV